MSHFERMIPAENENTHLALEHSQSDFHEHIPTEKGGDITAESAQAQERAEVEAALILKKIGQLSEKTAGGSSEQENNEVGLDLGERQVEAKKVLEKIDLLVVKDIFAEMYRKSGLSSEPSLVSLERTEITAHPGGSANFVEKTITIGADFNPWAMRTHQLSAKEWRNEEQFTRGRLRADILGAFMHEQTHIIGKNVKKEEGKIQRFTKGLKSYFFGRQKVEHSSGYQMGGIEKGNFRTKYLHFNEAVTDKIGERVYDEYLKRTGDTQFFSDHSGAKYSEGYAGARAMTDIMVEILSASLEIPADTVWESIIQGYMSGIDLDESELGNAFDEIFTPDIKAQIAQWSHNDSDFPVEELHKLSLGLVSSSAAQERVRSAYEKFQYQLETHKESSK